MKLELKNLDFDIAELKKFSKEIRHTSEEAIDTELDKSIDTLKERLLNYVNFQITEKVPDPTKESGYGKAPKAKIEIIKEIFNVDITNSDMLKSENKGNTLNDNSNVMLLKNGRIKAWQNVNDSSSYFSQENYFKNRLLNGVIYDIDKGKFYKVPENAVKGIKVECSTDSGQTVNSDKKFDAYKSSDKITRRKGDSPDQRVAVWTTRKDDLSFMMRNAIDIDSLISDVVDGKYDSAITKLQDKSFAQYTKKAIEAIQNIKIGKVSNPGAKSFLNLQQLVKNLKATKRISEHETTYTLVTNYSNSPSIGSNSSQDSEELFLDTVKKEVFLWQIENEQHWLTAITKNVDALIKEYNKA